MTWSPRWSRVTAWVVLALALVAALLLGWVIADDLSYDGDKFDGLAAAIAGVGLGVVAVVAAPWGWFLWRGGQVAFAAGLVALAVPLLWLVWFGLG